MRKLLLILEGGFLAFIAIMMLLSTFFLSGVAFAAIERESGFTIASFALASPVVFWIAGTAFTPGFLRRVNTHVTKKVDDVHRSMIHNKDIAWRKFPCERSEEIFRLEGDMEKSDKALYERSNE